MEEERMELDESELLRPNSLFLRGVDNLSEKDIKSYVKRYVSDHFKFEWINDSSLNIVFEENEQASNALKSLSQDTSPELDNSNERLAHQFDPMQKDVEFWTRVSKIGDKKIKHASQYSRYYLLNPDEEKKYKMKRNLEKRYRDREPLGRRARMLSDEEDDDEDLFPEKASKANDIDKDDSVNPLSERMKNPISQRLQHSNFEHSLDNGGNALSQKDLDDDDLFKR
ncbi:NCBP3 domain-containing protein CYBJADRAFT_167499 [Cyberlindnera jadinii NRRL Y-1542]|uniref:Uncharacterized protein n=1 Tax=Cyberlindnera jadinii (strain ATCC 18201 / CBS 1600 / BCRC 20928 / JCM 3617 / NBRC 0987 / NRRL Y-1542) TaxID=983966 RepID=A0A1E4S1X0_CYBJN|nr:hypothetical protein CYBJADRAFT_167499 [Cyberlindnera jadinii NRRL Y-1542]ODV73450.1 hypothetical protein CYBJADRAFT_167499 [Cyberlindnera jadinii NRRL Y-1542]